MGPTGARRRVLLASARRRNHAAKRNGLATFLNRPLPRSPPAGCRWPGSDQKANQLSGFGKDLTTDVDTGPRRFHSVPSPTGDLRRL
jgi:hypothetical protein